jgi:hypothetical protein
MFDEFKSRIILAAPAAAPSTTPYVSSLSMELT